MKVELLLSISLSFRCQQLWLQSRRGLVLEMICYLRFTVVIAEAETLCLCRGKHPSSCVPGNLVPAGRTLKHNKPEVECLSRTENLFWFPLYAMWKSQKDQPLERTVDLIWGKKKRESFVLRWNMWNILKNSKTCSDLFHLSINYPFQHFN